MQPLLAERSVLKRDRPRIGNAGFYSAPTDAYRTLDGWIIVQAIGNDMFARWARLVGRDDLINDPRYADDNVRQCNREPIDQAMREWLSTRTSSQARTYSSTERPAASACLRFNWRSTSGRA